MKNQKAVWARLISLSLLGIIAFCIVAIAFQIFTTDVLPISFIGACLGALISAIITHALLRGQTEHEEIKECNVSVFKKKSKLFRKFIKKLSNVLDKQKITIDEYEKLMKYFSIRLMIYLKEKSSEFIAERLGNIGEFVFENNKSYEDLKKNIVEILNTLSKEFSFGGKIDLETYSDLEKPIFPNLFKQAILNELNKNLQKGDRGLELEEGKYVLEKDLITDGEWGGEYVCFDFRRFKGCKLLIGSFSKYCPHAGVWVLLFIEKSIRKIDKFRYNDENEYKFCAFSKYLIEVLDDAGSWAELTSISTYNNDEYMALGKFDEPKEDEWLFLDEPSMIESYRNNYQEVASIIGKRAAYWFDNGRIREKKGGTSISIIQFLEKYIGNK